MQQPEALLLADALENGEVYESHSQPVYGWCRNDPCDKAAAELRRLHALNAELVEALDAALIGLCAAQGNRCADMAAHQVRAALSKAKEQP